MPNIAPAELVLASASGSTGGCGKIGTIAATSGTLLVRCDNTYNSLGNATDHIDWRVKTDKACTVQLLRSRAVPTATITLTDATAVDADDTFVLNGNTYTYKAGANVLASRYIGLGADNAAAAANTAAMLSDQTYGIIGATAVTAAVDATDVITITPTTATVLQFAQGASAANEVAWGAPAVTGLVLDGTATTISATNAAYAGQFIEQTVDGWPYAWCLISNSTSDAQTVTVAATKY